MLVEIQGRRVVVRKDTTDPKFGSDDSWFMHRLKARLRAIGKDCIKKRAYKDGNLVDESMFYIRERKGRWYIYDDRYAIRSVATDFDSDGEVTLCLSDDEGVFHETRS